MDGVGGHSSSISLAMRGNNLFSAIGIRQNYICLTILAPTPALTTVADLLLVVWGVCFVAATRQEPSLKARSARKAIVKGRRKAGSFAKLAKGCTSCSRRHAGRESIVARPYRCSRGRMQKDNKTADPELGVEEARPQVRRLRVPCCERSVQQQCRFTATLGMREDDAGPLNFVCTGDRWTRMLTAHSTCPPHVGAQPTVSPWRTRRA